MPTYVPGSPTGWMENGVPVPPPQYGWSGSGGQTSAPGPYQTGSASNPWTGLPPSTVDYVSEQKAKEAKNRARAEAQGYSLEARPYDFDPNAFKNPYYDQDRKRIDDLMSYYQGGTGQFGELGGMYAQSARGEGPSFAQESFKRANEDAIANALALRASARGNPGTASRMAFRTIGESGVANARDLAAARIQEVETARRGLMDFEKIKGDFTSYFLQQGMNLNQAQWAANIKLQELQAEQHATAQGTAAGIKAAKAGRPGFGDILAGGLAKAAAVGIGALIKPGTTAPNTRMSGDYDYAYNPNPGFAYT